jgi:hypothetical protein
MDPVAFYNNAKESVRLSGFSGEINWQSSRNPSSFCETDLLRECAWVILCTGFRESIIRRRFSFISMCFYDWESSALICADAEICVATALTCFANRPKVVAITRAAFHIREVGFESYRRRIIEDPIPSLLELPFVGAVTAFHLAKNLGFEMAKADRHLQRLSDSMGFSKPQQLCDHIAERTGDPVRVVDLVLWRYMERLGGRGGSPVAH